jgi:beta-1,4-N-acetylglucosaminyltransferase
MTQHNLSHISKVALVTDRGGHWQNARMLFEQIGESPSWVLTTAGPEVATLKASGTPVVVLPYLFSWVGKRRLLNPVKALFQCALSIYWAIKMRPQQVVSLGATDVVFFCYAAWLLGARVYHVECMNQVWSPSITGKLLYPICEKLYVQWPELLSSYGDKAEYAGWVISEAA